MRRYRHVQVQFPVIEKRLLEAAVLDVVAKLIDRLDRSLPKLGLLPNDARLAVRCSAR